MGWLTAWITYQWQRKLVALLTAIILWMLVNQSILDTVTISNVPIRVINVPEDKTIPGLQPNGIIGKRVTLTLTGTKEVVDALEPGDIAILLDAGTLEQNDWIAHITKKNLVSLNPSIDLANHITEIQHPEFVLKVSKLATAKIPVTIHPPTGHPPQGYTYLDIWPQSFRHTVVGPEELVTALAQRGLEISIDLNTISKAQLDTLPSVRDNFHDDEVMFLVPAAWKKVSLPFKGGSLEELNDPEAQSFHIDFLRKECLPIGKEIAIRPFYPLSTAQTINPETAPLIADRFVKQKDLVYYLALPLFICEVSPLFLEIIRDHLEISLLAQGEVGTGALPWSVQVVDPHALEDRYVNALLVRAISMRNSDARHTRKREMHLRARFRDFLQKLVLYTAPDKKLQLDVRRTKEGFSVVPVGQ